MATEVIVIPPDVLYPGIGGNIAFATQGSVLFIGPNSTFAQNNSNFFWDDTNSNLLLGTSSILVPSKIYISIGSAIERGIIIKAAPAQTAVLQEWQDSLGNRKIAVDQNGVLLGGTDVILRPGTSSGGNSVKLQDDASTNALTFSRDGGLTFFKQMLFSPGGTLDIGVYNSNNGPRNIDAGGTITAGIMRVIHSENVSTTAPISLIIDTKTGFGPGVGYGTTTQWRAESSTTEAQDQASLEVSWSDATDATRKSRMIWKIYDTTNAREWLRVTTNGTTPRAQFSSQVNVGTATTLTIATGVITVTKTYHAVDTESSAASDDLDTISGGSEGDILYLRAANSARTVVAKDGTGNLKLAGDFSMDNAEDILTLIFDGSNWLETSRSDNGA